MKTIFVLLLLFIFSDRSHAGNIKNFDFKNGSVWKLNNTIKLDKDPKIAGATDKYMAIWDIKNGAFVNSHLAKSDSCQFQGEANSETSKEASIPIPMGESFLVSSTNETLERITIDLIASDQKKPLRKIRIECIAYVNGISTEKLKIEFKNKLSTSLGRLFSRHSS